jgi:hypothetical protein
MIPSGDFGRTCAAFSMRGAAILSIVALMCGCATVQSRFAPLGKAYEPRPEAHPILVFRDNRPDRPFLRVARLDVHLEKTHLIGSSFADALPELQRQARLAGADAIIDIDERTSQYLETRTYHVAAIAIRFGEPN